ncbi:MAG: hypothetical protein IPO78_12925 [Saprospiraceae bacterium]|nr:hypothetical protein [Saprospiraceae bacterium]MBK9220651.1 hypothetical protein [Saprospiraceae bacterium]MBK9722500.1 hypothetical protein [Saprospiraceae bacterium]
MNKTFTFLSLFWFSTLTLFSQFLEQRLQERISTLDLNQVPSGILYERSLECQPLKMLNGNSLNDSINFSPNYFAFAYGMLLWADIDTTTRIENDSFFDLV